jgi:hypothetical protein
MSLSSAGFAGLVQTWIRRYKVMTQPRQSPRGRALIRAYVRLEGSLNSLQLTVDFLHLLLDGSIFSFLIGLIVLLPLKRTDVGSFITITIIVLPLSLLYLNLSLISFFSHTIYSTPISRLICNIRQATRLILPFRSFPFKSSPGPRSNSFLRFDWSTLERADQVARNLTKIQPLLLKMKIVEWVIGCLHDDQELEQFLESIHGFYNSDLEKEPAELFRSFHEDRVPRAILSFMHRTLSSATLTNDIKQKRIKLSLVVIELDPYLLERTFFHALSLPAKLTIFQCVDFVLFAGQFAGDTNASSYLQLLAKCTIALAISHLTAQEPDQRWPLIVESWLSFSIYDIPSDKQLASMKFVNLVWLVKELNSANSQYLDQVLCYRTLRVARNFQMENVASKYKHEFCILWNQLHPAAGVSGSNASLILPNIRTVYDALHRGTNNTPITPDLTPAHYPRCDIDAHLHDTHPTQGPSVSSG